jgi:hypothetical protein
MCPETGPPQSLDPEPDRIYVPGPETSACYVE